MRILYYNWADYLDPEKRGGGVSVYQRNLVKTLSQREGIETGFLSAGLAYRVRSSRPHVVRQKGAGPRRWVLVNSGTLAPSHAGFAAPEQLDHAATVQAFAEFVARTGPWDVIHFNNLEGLPASVLSLKERFPETRFILSLHNYYPICPQVNLWHRELHACTDFDEGQACTVCLPFRHDARLLRIANAVAYRLKCLGIRPGSRSFDILFRQCLRIGGRSARAAMWVKRNVTPSKTKKQVSTTGAVGFRKRREDMVSLINDHCDVILCVSDRVRAIAMQYGLDADRLHTDYIGTGHAGYFDSTQPAHVLLGPDGTVRLGYLGYMRPDKGFYFLLDALESLPDADAARLHLLIAAQAGPASLMARVARLRGRLASVKLVDGYTAEGLDSLLEAVDLGLIPVMWEDNLPQVAIEIHARHIPLLTSDMGGASELGGDAALIHRAGDVGSFATRIADVLAGRIDLARYWGNARRPVSMAAHLDALRAFYADGA